MKKPLTPNDLLEQYLDRTTRKILTDDDFFLAVKNARQIGWINDAEKKFLEEQRQKEKKRNAFIR